MSYARFGCDGSDVYVFTSSTGIECCMCALQDVEWVSEPKMIFGGYLRERGEHVQQEFTSNAGMIAHLEAHTAAGHTVPDYVFERLRDPKDAAANERIWRATAPNEVGAPNRPESASTPDPSGAER